MTEEEKKKGTHRRVGEERTEISPGDRRRLRTHDGKTKEIPDHKKKKDKK
jgi:hypothetical protein